MIVLIILGGIVVLTFLISPLFCRRFRRDGRIFVLHSLRPMFFDVSATPASSLNCLLDQCHRRGLRLGSIEEAIARNDTIALTFDDAYDDVMQVLPLLREHPIPMTVFVPTAFIGDGNSWDNFLLRNRRRHLSPEQIKELAAAGVEFGSHSHRHGDLTRLSEDGIEEELRKSKEILESLTGREVRYVAYPFGRCNERVLAVARRLGYRVGLQSRPQRADGFSVGRTPLNRFNTEVTIGAKLQPNVLSGCEYLKTRIIARFSSLTPLMARFS